MEFDQIGADAQQRAVPLVEIHPAATERRQLRRAHKRKVPRVKDQHQPTPGVVARTHRPAVVIPRIDTLPSEIRSRLPYLGNLHDWPLRSPTWRTFLPAKTLANRKHAWPASRPAARGLVKPRAGLVKDGAFCLSEMPELAVGLFPRLCTRSRKAPSPRTACPFHASNLATALSRWTCTCGNSFASRACLQAAPKDEMISPDQVNQEHSHESP